ncbi:hypothetical protein LWI29_014288 [Acer saccharum]|uniref:Uncharacterized protein n=1 Tax=Acer saccharum TaxID=4024 RepID=A0AA39W5F4_ACESA|nr:hypothetical protein LWI29_014288 [Acer saccharum]
MFNKNSDTATSKGVVDSLESPAVSDENCENQSSSDPFEQVMKIMESRDQEGEIPSNLLGSALQTSSPAMSFHVSLNSPTQPPPIVPTNSHKMVTRAKAGVSRPRVYESVISIDISKTTPSSVKEALKSPAWKEAMQSEFDALQRSNT